MLLRISLIVAILASIGSLLVSHMQLSKKITGLESDLSYTQGQLSQTQGELAQAQSDLQAANDLAEQTQRTLDQTRQSLADMTSRESQQRGRADRAERDLNETRTELTASLRELAQWRALGITSDEVSDRLQNLTDLNKAFMALQDENGLLLRNRNDLQARLDIYEKDIEPPPPPMPGVKGQVVAVDPKWDFVVLDVGGKQGALKRGEMLINREGRLVAKVRITRVEEDYCFANVLPNWKQADVVVGDQALGDPAM